MELLALFTPEAVAGQAELPKARRATGQAAEQVLLDALGLPSCAGAHEAAQSLIRLAALTQLASLYSSVAPEHQQQLIQVALQFTPSTCASASCICNPRWRAYRHSPSPCRCDARPDDCCDAH